MMMSSSVNALILFIIYIQHCFGAPAGCDMFMFVTKSVYRPGLFDFSGKAEADQICDNLAQNLQVQGPPRGEFRAFMSTSSSDIRDELGIFETNICLPNGELVISGSTELLFDITTTPLQKRIDRDEQGQQVGGDPQVWTGTKKGGTKSGRDCDDWTRTSGGDATVGDYTRQDPSWLEDKLQSCSNRFHLYCYEVIERSCRTVFVTSATMSGNIGGWEEADQICHDESLHQNTVDYIKAPVLAGSVRYRAIFSNASSDAVDRLGLTDTDCVRRADGQLITTDGLVNRSPVKPLLLPISLSNDGTPGTKDVWTGSVDNLRLGSNFCNDWQSSFVPFTGIIGDTQATDYRWTNDNAQPCSYQNGLYCLSVDVVPSTTTVAESKTPVGTTATTVAAGASTTADSSATSSSTGFRTDTMSNTASVSSVGQSGTDGVTMTTAGVSGGTSSASQGGGGSTATDSATSSSSSNDNQVDMDETDPENLVLFIVGGVVVFILLAISLLCLLVVRKRRRRTLQRRRGGAHSSRGHSHQRSLGSGSRLASRRSRTSQYDQYGNFGPQLPDHPAQQPQRARVSQRAPAPLPGQHYASAPALSDGTNDIPLTEVSNSTYGSLSLNPAESVSAGEAGGQYGNLVLNSGGYARAPALI